MGWFGSFGLVCLVCLVCLFRTPVSDALLAVPASQRDLYNSASLQQQLQVSSRENRPSLEGKLGMPQSSKEFCAIWFGLFRSFGLLVCFVCFDWFGWFVVFDLLGLFGLFDLPISDTC